MTASRTVALLQRAPDEIIACVRGTPVTAGTFQAQVNALAAQLPEAQHVLNLVRDRYAFTVAFTAIVAAGKTNLLPPTDRTAVQVSLASDFDRVHVLHDGCDIAPGLTRHNVSRLPAGPQTPLPEVPLNFTAALSFTSGSTGHARPIAKSLGMFFGAVAAYREVIMPVGAQIVATVPPQHMYGLELASLFPLWHAARFTACKPLFPADVQKELRNVEAPRVLVTTPLHLRALVDSQLDFPALERVLSATAPLDTALAQSAEQCLGTQVIDVFGCSEAGCMATRRVARESRWEPLAALNFRHTGDDRTLVDGPYFDEPVPLADRLALLHDGRFELAGRLGDQINVAGKRGSLEEITRCMLAVPGVDDAIAFMPPRESDNQRPVGLYTGSASRQEIRNHLRRALDDVFVPRPLLRVERLPRTDASKLPREELLRLYRQSLEDR